MAILFRKHERLSNLADQNSAKKVCPTITYNQGYSVNIFKK